MEKSSPKPSYGDMQERPPDDRTSSVDPEKMQADWFPEAKGFDGFGWRSCNRSPT